MSKQFTVDDIVEVTKAAYMMGVDAYWVHILFKGCTEPVQFYASPHANNDFGKDMFERLKAGEFGELHHGFGEWYKTQPKEQDEVEADAVAKRNQLLLESDWTDIPASQDRLSTAQKTAWAEYRQALRDITDQEGYPWNVVWPAKP